MSLTTIRPAAPPDTEALTPLLAQLGYPAAAPEVAARLHRLGTDGRAAAFVAQQGEMVVGLATAHLLGTLVAT